MASNKKLPHERASEIKTPNNVMVGTHAECDIAEKISGSTRKAVESINSRYHNHADKRTMVEVEYSIGKNFRIFDKDFEDYEITEVCYDGMTVEVVLKETQGEEQ